jgi:ribosomal-protein-alanine N-acetyltransferase
MPLIRFLFARKRHPVRRLPFHVRRGVSQTATLGYWIGEPYSRRGLMKEAVLSSALRLRPPRPDRVEAACLPHNSASIRLLKACGFTEEGYARQYLRINGDWHDHLLFAILAEDREPHNRRNFSQR